MIQKRSRVKGAVASASALFSVAILGATMLHNEQTQPVSAATSTASTTGATAQSNTATLTSSTSAAAATSSSATTATAGATTATTTPTVVNSHSNLNPAGSFAYVTEDGGNVAAVNNVVTTPVADDPDTDTIMEPAGMTTEQSDEWLANAKKVALLDYTTTGREQKIIRVAATVATISIGNSSIPSVDAIDVSSYQSNLTQANYNKLKALGVKGVVVKTTEGTGYTNPYAKTQIARAKAAGLNVTVYHYATFTSATSAKNEAKYTASVLSSLGVSKSTLVFADMEEPTTIGSSSVSSWLNTYWSTLNSYGYTNHGVYTSYGYTYRAQMVNTVGAKKAWIAGYPYNPSKNSLQYTSYGAWQFSSTAQFSGYGSYVDVSHDYAGILTGGSASSGSTVQTLNKYVTVTSASGSLWQNFSWTKKANVSSLYHHTVLAKYAYSNANGSTYYSLYNAKGTWLGYINAGYVKVGSGQEGVAVAANSYVTITATSGSIWQNFNWTEKAKAASLTNHTALVKGVYYHYNGSQYYSLYTTTGKWLGYINSQGTKVINNAHGSGVAIDKWVTVTSNSGSFWKNFDFDKKGNLSSRYHQTLHAERIYYDANGSSYYSMYTKSGTWVGYMNTGYGKTGSGEQGAAVSTPKYVTVTGTSGSFWSNFKWAKKSAIKDSTNRTILVQYSYYHANGATYYSAYTYDGKWLGYINAAYTKASSTAQGPAYSVNKTMTVTGKSGYTWANFKWAKKATVASLTGDEVIAKYAYYHANGATYYSLYSKAGAWLGYINGVYLK